MNVTIDPGAALDALHQHMTDQAQQLTAAALETAELRQRCEDAETRAERATEQVMDAVTRAAGLEAEIERLRELAADRIDLARERRTQAETSNGYLAEARAVLLAKLDAHRRTSTRNTTTGEYKNPVRQGYDAGLTEALAVLGVDAKEARDGE